MTTEKNHGPILISHLFSSEAKAPLVTLLLADPNFHGRVEISSKRDMTQVRLTHNKGVGHMPERAIRADLLRT